jgi:hypothetical protein
MDRRNAIRPARRTNPLAATTATARTGLRPHQAKAAPPHALASAVTACRQVRTAATDHDVLLLTVDVTRAAATSGEPQ